MKTMEDSLDYMQLGEKVEKSGLGKFKKSGSWKLTKKTLPWSCGRDLAPGRLRYFSFLLLLHQPTDAYKSGNEKMEFI